METPKHFKCYNRQKVGILLIFSVGFGLFLQSSSSSSEETTCESSSNFNNSYCGFRKYIMKSYFEKYDSLLEPIFQNFIADELFNTCKLLPDNLKHLVRVSVPWRHLIGEGSHRQISTTIRFHMQSDSVSWLRAHFCKVIVIERLPTGVFADPFELQHLLKRGVFTDVAVFGDTNLELPSVLSNRSAVEIHMNVAPTSLVGHKNELEISADLPLHVRYPPLDDSGYSEVKFGEPEIFLSCSVEENGDHESCLLVPTKDRTGSRTDDVVWRIPSGIRVHAGIVSAVTFLAASISTLLIVLSSVFYPDNKLGNNPKES